MRSPAAKVSFPSNKACCTTTREASHKAPQVKSSKSQLFITVLSAQASGLSTAKIEFWTSTQATSIKGSPVSSVETNSAPQTTVSLSAASSRPSW